MHNIMKKISIVLLMISMLMVSCTKDDSSKNTKYEDFVNSINKDEEVIDPTIGLEFEVIVDEELKKPGWWTIATLWKKKNGECIKFGICQWFPTYKANLNFVGREVCFPLIYDETNSKFEDIRFEFTSSPTFLSKLDLVFSITEDFIIDVPSNMNLPFSQVKIAQDEVFYDSTIGAYGGYILNIVGVNN